jgi:hypothetical protein
VHLTYLQHFEVHLFMGRMTFAKLLLQSYYWVHYDTACVSLIHVMCRNNNLCMIYSCPSSPVCNCHCSYCWQYMHMLPANLAPSCQICRLNNLLTSGAPDCHHGPDSPWVQSTTYWSYLTTWLRMDGASRQVIYY